MGRHPQSGQIQDHRIPLDAVRAYYPTTTAWSTRRRPIALTTPFALGRWSRCARALATRGSRQSGRAESQLAIAFPQQAGATRGRGLRADRDRRSTGRRLVLHGNSRLVSPVGPHPLRDAEDIGQPVDRHNEHALLDSLDAPGANEAHDAERPVACPPSPVPRQPVGLLPHSTDVTCFVRPRRRGRPEARWRWCSVSSAPSRTRREPFSSPGSPATVP